MAEKSSPDLQTQSHLKDDSPETENLMCNKDKSEESPSIHGSVGCNVEITTMPTTDDENPLPPSTPASSDKHLFSSTPSSSGTHSENREDLYDPSPRAENLMYNTNEESPSIQGPAAYVEIATMPTTDDENPLPPSTPASSDKHLFSSSPSSSGTQYLENREDLHDPSTNIAIPSATEEILPQEKGSKIENMI
ncbi:hypothetical protein CDAR_510661 [Caerostris darwini]|uniref:Uncharacterized protein n=1 Tax=Caerostris darwini TaxID=1538125 RepID=A0AAV4R6Q1_9ARAC|nr:hypothetical protein CDAR_510661 [Caerostris darwini]